MWDYDSYNKFKTIMVASLLKKINFYVILRRTQDGTFLKSTCMHLQIDYNKSKHFQRKLTTQIRYSPQNSLNLY